MSAEQRLIDETPQLVPLYELLKGVLPHNGERAEVMRLHLVRAGVRPSMWRLLHKVGCDWMAALLPFYKRGPLWKATAGLDLLLLAQSFGTHSLAPGWLLHALMSQAGNPNRPSRRYLSRLNDLDGLNARLGRWVQNEQLEPVLRDNAQLVFHWATTQWRRGSGHGLKRLTLQSLLRVVAEHEARERARAMVADPWPTPVVSMLNCQLNGCEAVVIRNALELWEEGQTMRHCAYEKLSTCASGGYVVVSLRPVSGGRPLATVGIRRTSDQALFHQVTGFANQAVSRDVQFEARRLSVELHLRLKGRPSHFQEPPAIRAGSANKAPLLLQEHREISAKSE
ncbi:MAG: PcfJ domain-containing protein [Hydrogenophaga sp.]|nr:PcfJ domain-containing protein [Hydrogenophaga sp.]